MTTRRGTTITVAQSLAHAPTSALASAGLTGSDFVTRWPDDLALISDVGLTDVRLSIDWARLQPRPGDLSGEWIEWYGDVLDALRALGLSAWACLLDPDRGVPHWLDNEGGLGAAETVVRWWPRWVERVADEFGDRIDGWIPAARTFPDLPTTAWRNTWGLLRSDAPVTMSLGSDQLARADELRGSYDLLGVVIDASDETVDVDDLDERLRLAGDRWAEQLGRAEEIADRPPIVSDVVLDDVEADLLEPTIARLVQIVDPVVSAYDTSGGAADDLAPAEVVFLGPLVSGDDGPGLFDLGRAPRPHAARFLDISPT